MTHVVLFRFADLDDARGAARRLAALADQVPSLRTIEVGVDTLRTPRSWDLCLITRFDDAAGMEAYQTHPAHVAVVEWIRSRATEVAAVDWLPRAAV